MKNRYGHTYDFVACGNKIYVFEASENMMKYCRYGGKPNADDVDPNDLGVFDLSGGPFVSEGFEFDGMKVKRIFAKDGKIFVEAY